MVKCESCAKAVCEGKHENRKTCEKPNECSCSCQEDPSTTFWKTAGSIGFGVAAFSGGVVLAVSTGGLGLVGMAAAAAGGALTGVGATAAIHPIAKNMSGERMTGGDYAKDVLIGGAVGAITGPIGAGGASVTTSVASKVGTEAFKQGTVKFGCRTAVGAVSGATASAIGEGINVASNDKATFSLTNVFKGAVLGAATGGASHITRNIASVATPGLVSSTTKIVSDTLSSVVIDGTSQYVTEGEIDPKRIALNAGARAATSTGYEVVSNATYNAHGGKDALRDKFGDKEILDAHPKDQDKILNAKRHLEMLDAKTVENLVNYAEIEQIKFNDQNIHALKSDHQGQIAADLDGKSLFEGGRTDRRVLFDVKKTEDGSVRFKIAGFVENHDYKIAPRFGEVSVPELNVAEPFLIPKENVNDEDEKEKRE